jgi:hypothetical protein
MLHWKLSKCNEQKTVFTAIFAYRVSRCSGTIFFLSFDSNVISSWKFVIVSRYRLSVNWLGYETGRWNYLAGTSRPVLEWRQTPVPCEPEFSSWCNVLRLKLPVTVVYCQSEEYIVWHYSLFWTILFIFVPSQHFSLRTILILSCCL